jgi:hypothetical protein
MTREEFQATVTIMIVPEGEPKQHSSGAGLAGDTTFWVHTIGLSKHGRPELEFRNVPILAVQHVQAELNEWGFYVLTEKAIQAEQNLQCEGDPAYILHASESDNLKWDEIGVPCLTLTVEAVPFTCGHCGGHHDGNHGNHSIH